MWIKWRNEAMQLAASGGFADGEHLALHLRLTLLSLAKCSSVILKIQEMALVFSLFSTSTTISQIRVRNSCLMCFNQFFRESMFFFDAVMLRRIQLTQIHNYLKTSLVSQPKLLVLRVQLKCVQHDLINQWLHYLILIFNECINTSDDVAIPSSFQ